jgi:iron complex transport system substrate-binding protein
MHTRVLSLLPAATEIIHELGAPELLVGISHLCRQPADRELPRVMRTSIDSDNWSMGQISRALFRAMETGQRLYELDEQRIAGLAPTLVLSQGLCPVCAASPGDIEGSAAACARLLTLTPRSLGDIADNIREVAAAIGRQQQGEQLAARFLARIEAVRERNRHAEELRVAVLEWFDPLWISGEWIAELIECAGATPLILGPSDPSRRVEWSELLAADPDAILLGACSMDSERTRRELPALESRPEWQSLRAVREGRVFLLDGLRHTSTPGPGLVAGLERIEELLSHARLPG